MSHHLRAVQIMNLLLGDKKKGFLDRVLMLCADGDFLF